MQPEMNNVEPDRHDLVILGRKVGTHNGWDQLDTAHLLFTNFVSAEGLGLPSGDLSVNYDDGTFEITDGDIESEEAPEPVDGVEEGSEDTPGSQANIVATGDIVALVYGLPRDDGASPVLMIQGVEKK